MYYLGSDLEYVNTYINIQILKLPLFFDPIILSNYKIPLRFIIIFKFYEIT